MSDPELIALVQEAAAKLGEEFDAVQIMVSWQDDKGKGTRSLFRGCGNWFARQGMAHDFIAIDEAETQAREISAAIQPPDDGEQWKKTPDEKT